MQAQSTNKRRRMLIMVSLVVTLLTAISLTASLAGANKAPGAKHRATHASSGKHKRSVQWRRHRRPSAVPTSTPATVAATPTPTTSAVTPASTPSATPAPAPAAAATTTTSVTGQTMGALNLSGVSNRVYENVTFDGAGSGGPDSSGVVVVSGGSHDITFRNCVINPNRDGVGNGIKIIGGSVSNITFENCLIKTQPRMGFECIGRSGSGYRNVDLVNCTFEPQGSEAVSYDDDTNQAGYCTVSGCLIKGGGATSQYSWGQGLELNNVANMTVTGNTLWSCRSDGWNLQMGRSSACGWTFTDNVIDFTQGSVASKSDASPVCAQHVYGGTFARNRIVNKVGWTSAYLNDCHNMDWRTTSWSGANASPYQTGCSGNQF